MGACRPRYCPVCRPVRTSADFGRASHCAGHAVSHLGQSGRGSSRWAFCVRLWRLLRRDHCAAPGGNRRPFRWPGFSGSDGPALHEFRAGATGRSRGVGYLVDFWNSDLIASCVAAACLIAAGYFFAAKPPQVRPRRASICAASAAPCENAGLYRFPAFGAPGHVTAGNGSIRSHWRRRLYRRATRGSDRALLLRSSPEHPSLQWVPSL